MYTINNFSHIYFHLFTRDARIKSKVLTKESRSIRETGATNQDLPASDT